MTPLEFMRSRRAPLRLVIYDCDGVLVDSEPVSNRLIADDLTARGWPMTAAEAEHRFIGKTFPDILPLVEAELGRPMPGWVEEVVSRLVATLAAEVTAIPGAIDALRATTALGLPWRVASNSSHAEMAAKFGRLGIIDLVAGRTHSHEDVCAGKPAPDLFLAAAAADDVTPAECVVIEDSATGMRAARAAGMDCLGFTPHGDGALARTFGAVPFHAMAELPALLRVARRDP